jgi:hypothetical protein
MRDLDERLFGLPGLLDYRATYLRDKQRILLELQMLPGFEAPSVVIAGASIKVRQVSEFLPYYPGKRIITVYDTSPDSTL